eukprot:COSAG06_NODE_40655_length_399_cov_0.491694_1_plen_81_part_01
MEQRQPMLLAQDRMWFGSLLPLPTLQWLCLPDRNFRDRTFTAITNCRHWLRGRAEGPLLLKLVLRVYDQQPIALAFARCLV